MMETSISILQLSTRLSHLAITRVSRYRFIDLKITVRHRNSVTCVLNPYALLQFIHIAVPFNTMSATLVKSVG